MNRQYVDGLVNIKDDAYTGLFKHCEGNILWVINNKQYWQNSLLLYYFACQDKGMKELNQRSLSAGEERILKYIYAGVRENIFDLDDPIATTKAIHSFLIGYAIKSLSESSAPSKTDVKKGIATFLDTILK